MKGLLAGMSVSEAARVAGTSRSWASHQVNQDPHFIATYQNEMLATLKAVQAVILQESERSLRVIRDIRDGSSVSNADRLRAAAMMLAHLDSAGKALTQFQPPPIDSRGLINNVQQFEDARRADLNEEMQRRSDDFDASAEGKRLIELENLEESLRSKAVEARHALESIGEGTGAKRPRTVAQLSAHLKQIEDRRSDVASELHALIQLRKSILAHPPLYLG